MKSFILLLAFLLLVILFSACKKDAKILPPSIILLSGPPYTADGSVIAVGHPILFGIRATSGSANITNLVVKKIIPDGSVKVVLDSGMNTTGFTLERTFYQNVEDTARWTFQLMDRNRLFATTALTLYKDPNSTWGGIFEYNSLTMGYQGSTEFGQFLDPSTGHVYFSDTASLYPAIIHIITYYFVDEELPSPTFSSAGELGGGITEYYPVIESWPVKNYTKWDISVDSDPVSAAAYESCHNDSLLIVSYDEVWGKRKFKWADPGDIIPFMTSTGKKGLIRVLSADHNPSGKIIFSMKIQQ
jgi:hypothetical protein